MGGYEDLNFELVSKYITATKISDKSFVETTKIWLESQLISVG